MTILLLTLKAMVPEADKAVKAVLFGKLSKREFLLHVHNTVTADSQKADFHQEKKLRILKPSSSSSSRKRRRKDSRTAWRTRLTASKVSVGVSVCPELTFPSTCT